MYLYMKSGLEDKFFVVVKIRALFYINSMNEQLDFFKHILLGDHSGGGGSVWNSMLTSGGASVDLCFENYSSSTYGN